jgi:taurine dioxygenase
VQPAAGSVRPPSSEERRSRIDYGDLDMNTEASAATLSRKANTLETLEIVSTGKALGAEIRGVDLSLPIPDDVKRAIRQAWLDRLVVLFRNQQLTPAQYLEAARIFGTPQIGGARKYYEKACLKSPVYALPQPEISVLSNLDEHGNPTERNTGLGSMEVVWHSDNSYIEKPPAGSCLYSLEVPAKSGHTSFNNQYLAYETLPADLKRAIQGRRSIQDSTRNSAGVPRPGAQLPERPADVPGPHHPLVRIHPETGKPALYLGRRRAYPSQYILGLSEEESEKLLDRLWAHATQDKLKWTHHWKVGDLVVWDNRCAMHYRDPVDPTQRRVMWRTQFQGEEVVQA